MRNIFFIIAITIFCLGCSSKHAVINGEFTLFDDDEIIILELISENGSVVQDTAYTKQGKFNFKIPSAPCTPTIYNVKHKRDIIPLILQKGDKINLKSIGVISQNYRVEGSEESSLMKEITTIMNDGALELDSLYKDYLYAKDTDDKKSAVKKYREHYYKIKRKQLSFIVQNKGSIAAIYALYQRLPDDNVLFNGTNDVIYYNMVADSVKVSYPSSPYISVLENEIATLQKIQQKSNNLELQGFIKDYPEIAMQDMYGKEQKLSSLTGKVVLLDFWLSELNECRLDNASLKEVYDKYSDKGFEIFQVALDTDKFTWVSTVQEQKLKWISVCDFYGENCSAVKNYNVKKFPANFLIDKTGKIVAKDIEHEKLEEMLKKLL